MNKWVSGWIGLSKRRWRLIKFTGICLKTRPTKPTKLPHPYPLFHLKGITEVTLFADNDQNFAGQAAAYQGANRLFRDGFKVNVIVPEAPDTDWLDVLQLKRSTPAKQYDLTVVH